MPEWIPYCGAAPLPGEWLARWNLDPVLLAAMALAGALWWLRQRRLSGAQGAVLGLTFVLFVSPLCALGSALFTARVVHHVLLAVLMAPLLVSALRLDERRIPLSLPVLTAVQALVFWAWHAPPLYAAALSSDALFWAMQFSIAASAAVWWARLRQVGAGAAVLALLATMVQMGVLGALLVFAGRALYAPHWLSTQAWGLSAMEDQQIAGLIMWAPASAVYLLLAATILYRSLRAEGSRGPAR